MLSILRCAPAPSSVRQVLLFILIKEIAGDRGGQDTDRSDADNHQQHGYEARGNQGVATTQMGKSTTAKSEIRVEWNDAVTVTIPLGPRRRT